MHTGHYIEMVHKGEEDLEKAFHLVAKEHGAEPDIAATCGLLAAWSKDLVKDLQPFIKRYKEEKDKEPDRLFNTLFDKPRKGSLGMLRDLHDLYLMASEANLSAIILRQAADGLRDEGLSALCDKIEKISKRQLSWLSSRMKAAAPQTLIVG